MWSDLTTIGGVTNAVTLPNDGIVSVIIPEGVELCAYINGNVAPMHHLHVKAGDSLYFQLASHSSVPTNVQVTIDGVPSSLAVIPEAQAAAVAAKTSILTEVPVVKKQKRIVHKHKHKHYYM
jgi:hypothetical protein